MWGLKRRRAQRHLRQLQAQLPASRAVKPVLMALHVHERIWNFNHCWPECAAEEHLMEIWQKEAGAVVYK
eukprot:COSAG01_NODE_14580_length_1436_cov_1.108452_2_plen_69_part_01